VINLGDDVPGAIKLDERVEVRVVAADRVPLNIDTHNCRRWVIASTSTPVLMSGAVPFFSTKS
jgi:hypothetical protein